MSKISYKEFYNKKLDDNIEQLNLSDPDMMEEFDIAIQKEYNQYLESLNPGKVQNVQSMEYFSELQEKFIKGFDQECYNSLIPARIYFLQLLSLIFKKQVDAQNWNDRKYYIETTTGGGKYFSPLIHFFWQQDTSSGKSKGQNFFKDVAKAISKQIAMTKKMKSSDRFYIQSTNWTETQETYLTRFQQKQTNKGIQLDFNAPPIPGLFQKSDIICSEECAFLFNEKQTTKQNLSELLLDSLEGKPLKKDLISWNGNSTMTYPNFIFSGLSRPTRNITADFFDKGLFQRMFVYTRTTNDAMQEAAIRISTKLKSCSKQYIQMLAKEFEDLYEWKIKNTPKKLIIKDNFMEKKIHEEYLKLSKSNKKAFRHSFLLQKKVNSFLSRYYSNYIYRISMLLALSRKSTIIEECDFKEAAYIIEQLIFSVQQFSEGNIKVEHTELQDMVRIKKAFFSYYLRNQNEFIERKELVLFLSGKLNITEKRSEGIIDDYLGIEFLIIKDDKIHIKQTEYEESIKRIQDSIKSKRKRK